MVHHHLVHFHLSTWLPAIVFGVQVMRCFERVRLWFRCFSFFCFFFVNFIAIKYRFLNAFAIQTLVNSFISEGIIATHPLGSFKHKNRTRFRQHMVRNSAPDLALFGYTQWHLHCECSLLILLDLRNWILFHVFWKQFVLVCITFLLFCIFVLLICLVWNWCTFIFSFHSTWKLVKRNLRKK